MFPVKEEPSSITPSAATGFSSSLHSTIPPSFPPPPLSFPSSNNPLSAQPNIPQPLQFDLFGGPATKLPSSPPKQPSQQNTFDLFGPPPPAIPAATQPKFQDNFANFDAVFNSLSVTDSKPAPTIPSSQPVSNGFLSSAPNSMQPTLMEPIKQSQPLDSTLQPEPLKEQKKDDGLPDYSALEALYKAEDEPVDFFGFGKPSNNVHNTSLSASSAANGFAKSSTIGDFGYQTPFPSSNNFGSPNISANTGLTSNPFFSMNNFQPSAFSTPRQPTPASVAPAPWLPSTTTNGTTATSANAQGTNWNPFQ
jgi:hypothetical protein